MPHRKKRKHHPKKFTVWHAIFFVALVTVLSVVVSALVITLYPVKTELQKSRTLAVVPGASITRQGNPSPALKRRLDKAIELYSQNQVRLILVSGTAPEALVMKDYLRKKGVEDKYIIADSEGVNTYRTVINARDFSRKIKTGKGTVFVSQKYHLPRIALLARRSKFNEVEVINADHKDVKNRNEYLLRESLALVKAFVFSR